MNDPMLTLQNRFRANGNSSALLDSGQKLGTPVPLELTK